MKVLFNCTTNTKGGGVKNSAMFIKYAILDKENFFYFAISQEVKDILVKWDIDTSCMFLFDKSPARSKNKRDALYKLANKLDVDLVFTMAGPAYVNFEQTHLMGISNPYITHTDFQGLSIGKTLKEVIKTVMLTTYQAYYALKADFWMFQTIASRNGFIKRYFKNREKTFVVNNAIGNEFKEFFVDNQIKYINLDKTINIFCPAADYYHKALHLIPKIVKELVVLSKNSYHFKFTLTIDNNSAIWKEISKKCQLYSVVEQVKNIGPYNYANVLNLFKNSDIVFVPSVLETFSASYLEAYASKKPLVVSDKKFVKDICKDAALYIDPFDSKKVAETLDMLIRDKDIQKKLISEGERRLNDYGNQEKRYEDIVKIFNKIRGANNVQK